MIPQGARVETMPPNGRPAEPPAIDGEVFRRAMGSFATGVTVITALDSEDKLCGLTANAFSSVSLEPPLILACINYSARCYKAIQDSGRFAVHILKSDQERLAKGFACRGGDRSQICRWERSELGIPVLQDFHTAIECAVFNIHPAGDHAILVGRVLDIHKRDEGTPLLYYGGRLFPLEP